VSVGNSRSKAQAAVWAVSRRTGVTVEDILGRRRIQTIASARHEAIWRVRQATDWSLPRVGRFFADRDHTTALHSLRCMERRAARDASLRAYMARIERPRTLGRPATESDG
jgi:chromosomal replication initiation ATPase DnaA